MRLNYEIFALLPFLHGAVAGTFSQLTDFGNNPSNIGMYIYVPDKLAVNPPLVVVPHWCHGNATNVYDWTPWATLAESNGFLVLYPDSPNTVDKCWDVSSKQTLTHNGGGDSLGIISAVKHTVSAYRVDKTRIFAVGTSSGAMMINVLLGAYPDVFAAGSAWAGVAFGCFSGDGVDVWNSACANGEIVKSGREWKRIVEKAYPGYRGYRPKFQIFHGSNDTILYPQNFREEIKEWTAVFGLSERPTKILANTPLTSWTKYLYGREGKFEATLATGVDHNIPTQIESVIAFFDLRCKGKKCFRRPAVRWN